MAGALGFLLSSGFWITALVMMAAGLWLPGEYTDLRVGIPIFLGGILFCTALKVDLAALLGALRGRSQWLRLLGAAGIKLVLLPLIGWGICRVVAPDWALGMLVVMAMPAGLSSSAMADLYRANVPFALACTGVTSALCPITIPLLIQAFDPVADIDPRMLAGRAGYIILLLATPLILAQLVRRFAPELVRRHYGRWGYGAVLSSCLLIFVSISSNRHAWEQLPATQLLLVLALCGICLLVAAAAGVIAHGWLVAGEAAALGFCCLWMNNSLAIAFCDRFYHGNGAMILPAVLMQVPIIIYVALFGRWTGRRSPDPER